MYGIKITTPGEKITCAAVNYVHMVYYHNVYVAGHAAVLKKGMQL